ncbi:hypothetical protein [Haladaptatus sp. NG-SE-30]
MTNEDQPTATSSTGNDQSETRIGRRRLLQSGIALGVSTALVWGFGTQYLSSDDLGRITYATTQLQPGAKTLEARTKEVPAAWHESLQLAFEVQENVQQAGISSLVGSFVIPGSYDVPEASLSVDATDESVTETLEELTEDVAFDVDIVEEIPPQPESKQTISDGYQISDLEGKRVPGGGVCKTGDSFGTLTPALFDAESRSRFFATSNHVFGAAGSKKTEHRGERLSILHDDEAHKIGDVVRGYPPEDLVKVAPARGYRPVPEIERASPSQVIGQYTKMGLADLVAREEKLTKVGAFSDHTSGVIKGIDGVTCYTGQICKRGQLKWGDEKTLKDGDSGSVNYHVDPENPDEYILVGGINNARTWWPGADFTWGTAGHHLLDEYGLTF